MTKLKALSVSAGAGLAVPVVSLVIWKLIVVVDAEFNNWLTWKIDYYFFFLKLLIWPSVFVFFASSLEEAPWWSQLVAFALSIGVNVLVYSGIGFLIWHGLNRSRPSIFVAAAIVLAYWTFILRMMFPPVT